MMVSSCSDNKAFVAEQPTVADYTIGEKWVWKYKGVTTQGEVRSDGTDAREIVNLNEGLGLTIENDTIPLEDIVAVDKSETPMYKWPLKVGKSWTYEKKWTSQDGTVGSQSQDVEVVSFKEETVKAGTFLAYTIVYKGKITNSRGYNANTEDIWLYAPELKNFIKLTQIQGDFIYNEELISYANPQKP